MKSFITAFITTIFIIGCTNQAKKEVKIIQLDSLANTISLKHPNYSENNIVFEDFANDLEKNIIRNITDFDFIDDYEMNILDMEKNKHGAGYAIHMYTNNQSNLFNYNYDIIFMTQNDSLAKSFNKTGKYKLPFCNKISQLSKTELELINAHKNIKGYYDPKFSIRKGIIGTDINIGAILCIHD